MEVSDALRLGKGGLNIVYRKTGTGVDISTVDTKQEIKLEFSEAITSPLITTDDRTDNRIELLFAAIEDIRNSQYTILRILRQQRYDIELLNIYLEQYLQPKGLRKYLNKFLNWIKEIIN